MVYIKLQNGSMLHYHFAPRLTICNMQALHGGWPERGRQAAPQRYGAKAARWISVAEDEPLGAVLGHEEYIIPGLPVFFIVPAKSHIEKQLLENELPIL